MSQVAFSRMLVVFAFSFIAIASRAGDEQGCIDAADDIVEKLSCLEDVTFAEVRSAISGIRHFEMKFRQPVDHESPDRGDFLQRVVLLHRSEIEPMVLQTSGYSIFGVRLTAIANLFSTNQIQIEHRFFSDSVPANLDWSKLNIKQSADDFHQITSKLKKIYKTKWVNTGASKGGMTSIYHRFFYPDDLDGTVADVAPHSFSTSDERYAEFVRNVGGEAYRECRENFKNLQIQLLQNRDLFTPDIKGDFSQLGSAEVAFEHSVIESVFYFWQYGSPDSKTEGCSAIPTEDVREMYKYLQSVADISDYLNSSISPFLPYYFQAATQLGNPANAIDHLMDLLQFDLNIDQYTPKGVDYSYSNEDMLLIDQWVRQSADKVIFIYGEFDPWTAGEFPVSSTGLDVKKYYAPKGNHGAKFTNLSRDQYAEVVDTLALWLNKSASRNAVLNSLNPKNITLEDEEFLFRKKHKL